MKQGKELEAQISEILDRIGNALIEHADLLNAVNEKHNRETLEGFWDYQTLAEAKEALYQIEPIIGRLLSQSQVNQQSNNN